MNSFLPENTLHPFAESPKNQKKPLEFDIALWLQMLRDFATYGLAIGRKSPTKNQRRFTPAMELLENRVTPALNPFLPLGLDETNLVILSPDVAAKVPGQELANASVLTLSPGEDSIDQISRHLAGRSGLETIRIISHGNDGALFLGDQALDQSVLASRGDEIASWGKALAPGADLLLYGCSVASSQTGKNFVNTLADLTGADVAASSNPTGAGGDITLECTRGLIHASLQASLQSWEESQLQLLDFSYTSSGTAITITGYTGAGGSVAIPDAIDGLPVTTIGSFAFSNRTSLTSVILPSTVTSIGQQAFLNCTNLESVMIPNSVTSIGQQSFLNCTSLESINIPNSVTSIGYQAFFNCTSLNSISIGSGASVIGTSAFYGCTNLNSINVDAANPNFSSTDGILFNKLQTTLIQCPGGKIGSIFIPDTVTSIGASAFQNCAGITSVTLGNAVTSIGNFAFSGCTSLANVFMPNSVASIGASAFQGCSNLSAISIPGSVTAIGSQAFLNCSSLSAINIPSSVTAIGSQAFLNCSSLSAVMVDASNPNFSSADGILFNKLQTTLIQCPAGKSGDIIIPGTVVSIGSSAFQGCSGVTSISIPGSVNTIGSQAFFNCSSLTAINVNPANTSFSSADGILFNKLQTTLIQCPTGKSGSAFIPASVTSISSQAFLNCSNLGNIIVDAANPNFTSTYGILFNKLQTTLIQCPAGKSGSAFVPASVASIGSQAFLNCFNLSGILVDTTNANFSSTDGILFNKLQSTLIQCPAGKTGSIIIPNTVNTIGFQAFLNCTKLSAIMVDAANPTFSSDEGILYNKLQTTLIQCPAGKPGSVTIPATVNTIGFQSFLNCANLVSVTIPVAVNSIGDGAFQGCAGLTSVYFLGKAPSLGLDVFQNVPAIAYHLPGAAGFNNSFGGLPTAVFNLDPLDLFLSSSTLEENSAIGAEVGTLATTQGNTMESFTYSLVEGTGDNDNVAFSIEGNSLKMTVAPDFESKSSYSVRIRSTAADGVFIEKSFTITITDVNDAPVGNFQTIALSEDAPFAAGILSGSDAEGSPLTFSIVNQGGKGFVEITNASTGEFTYIPNPDANGMDYFTFQVHDGSLTSALATVAVQIAAVNDAPVNTALPAITSGSIHMGTILSVSTGDWNDDRDGNPGLVFSYQWFRRDHQGNVFVILNATSNQYTLQPGDMGKYIWAEVTATDQGTPGNISVSAVSNELWLTNGKAHSRQDKHAGGTGNQTLDTFFASLASALNKESHGFYGSSRQVDLFFANDSTFAGKKQESTVHGSAMNDLITGGNNRAHRFLGK